MKIIQVDNFNRESISDILVAENVHKSYIKLIVKSPEYLKAKQKALEDHCREVEEWELKH